MFDAIIIGSGPAGVFTAAGLRGKRILMLDVGHRPGTPPRLEGNLQDLRRREPDLFEQLIGTEFQSLRNLQGRAISLKLKSPGMAYILRDWEKLSPLESRNFEPMMSFAAGGLANGWGAGVYRFTKEELAEFPVSAEELTPWYDEVSRHIGISGDDSLSGFFGKEPQLQPGLRLSSFASELLARYNSRAKQFVNSGLFIGLPRLAVLTQPHNGRSAYAYENLEFFRPYNPAVYNPAFTLDQMVRDGELEYRAGYLASRFTETPNHVEVLAKNLNNGQMEKFEATSLVLAAGALNSAKIVLASNDDFETRLPILDNPMAAMPIFDWRRIGKGVEAQNSSLAQLNLVYQRDGQTVQATLYGATGPLRSDVVMTPPLTVRANLLWTKYLAPATMMVMVFYPGSRATENFLRLKADGVLEVNYEKTPFQPVEEDLIRLFRNMGYWTHRGMVQRPRIGNGLHYAGTLPMKDQPARYETDRDGLLSGGRRVYVSDGAAMTSLPAKNLTFTIMANAMRIGSRLKEQLL